MSCGFAAALPQGGDVEEGEVLDEDVVGAGAAGGEAADSRGEVRASGDDVAVAVGGEEGDLVGELDVDGGGEGG